MYVMKLSIGLLSTLVLVDIVSCVGWLVGFSLMKGAEELCIRKPVIPEYGGGNKEFVFEDRQFFVGSDNLETFFTSQERQSIVRHMLFSLRAHQGDILDDVRFLEGQAIGRYSAFGPKFQRIFR